MWRKVESEQWTSSDGGLRIEQFVGEWQETGEVGRWALLSDARTGAIQLDLSAVHDSRVELAADGTVLVRLDQGRNAALLRIDPAARSFRNLGRDDAAAQPLGELSEAVAAELEAMRVAPGRERSFSPDGAIRVDFTIETGLMSRETRSPRVVETATGRILLDLPPDWDAHILWEEGGAFLMHLRRCSKQGYLTVSVDPRAGVYRIAQDDDRPYAIEGMQAGLERAFDRAGMATAPTCMVTAVRARLRRNRALALGGIGLLATLAFVAWFTKPASGHGVAAPNMFRSSLLAGR